MIWRSAVPRSLGTVALFLLFAPSPSRAKPEPECISSATRPEIRVCSQLADDEMRPGRVTTWRLWVEGTREAVDIRVHNATPGVVRLKGGNDQIVRTQGGRRNEARIRVATLAPGAAFFEYHLHFEDDRQQAAEIAARIAPYLAKVRDTFAEYRVLLSGPTASPEAMKNLLDETEVLLHRILSYPELAAMRDSVATAFRQARADLRPHSSRLPQDREIALAAFQRPDTDSVLARIAALLARLSQVAETRDLLVDLCITSQPRQGATVRLHAQSYPDGARDQRTSGRLTLYRGRYVYKATLRGQKAIECVPEADGKALDRCAPLDLLLNAETVFDCDFGLQGCALRSGPGDCR